MELQYIGGLILLIGLVMGWVILIYSYRPGKITYKSRNYSWSPLSPDHAEDLFFNTIDRVRLYEIDGSFYEEPIIDDLLLPRVGYYFDGFNLITVTDYEITKTKLYEES